MNRVIWKFPVPVPNQDGLVKLHLPIGSEVLCFGKSHHNLGRDLVAWASCFEHNAHAFKESDHHETIPFLLVNTGKGFHGDGATYVQTLAVGEIVWHIFQLAGPRYITP